MLDQKSVDNIERVRSSLIAHSSFSLEAAVTSGAIVDQQSFALGKEGDLAAFYSPFDWINENADIVIIGITPGMDQALAALKSLHRSLHQKIDIMSAAKIAKQEASFKGQMRTIAARLMDHFNFPKLFGIEDSSDLFGRAAHRVHYTSAFRYPVLKRVKSEWKNYPGQEDRWSRSALLSGMVENLLIPELAGLPNAWLIPFGPVPASVLEHLANRNLINRTRILAGLNHPTGQQQNRHNCQLNLIDHKKCAPNVGCNIIQARSIRLKNSVGNALAKS